VVGGTGGIVQGGLPECKPAAPSDAWEPRPSPIADAPTHSAYLDALIDWAEDTAVRNPRLLLELAREAEDRVNAPAEPDEAESSPSVSVSEPWSQLDAELVRGGATSSRTRAVISTVTRYLCAATKIDAAFEVLVAKLEAVSDAAAAAIGLRLERGAAASDGPGADDRLRAVLAKIDGTSRRRRAIRHCLTADAAVPIFRCRCCKQVKLGQPMSCGHRACPRCVRKLRLQNQAKVATLLELVDERRLAATRAPATWRFLTLTLPSLDDFRAMRELVGRCWGRLLRTNFWKQVGAGVTALETTRTRAGWHVHAHAVVDEFLPFWTLCRAWQGCAFREYFRDLCGSRRFLRARRPRLLGGLVPSSRNRLCATFDLAEQKGGDGVLEAREIASHVVGVLRRITFVARELGGDIDLRELVDPVIRDRRTLHGSPARRRVRVLVRRLVRDFFASLPRPQGQEIHRCQGGRQQVVRQLSKYLGKDLGCAGVPEELSTDPTFGVAGTAEALAEFIGGTFRWRALRAYGDAYDAQLRDRETSSMECVECSGELEAVGVRWLSPIQQMHLDQQQRCDRARRRGEAERLTRQQQDAAAAHARVCEHALAHGLEPPPPQSPAPDTSTKVRRLVPKIRAPDVRPEDLRNVPPGKLRAGLEWLAAMLRRK
jgi:hypothetical protein